MTSAVVYQFVTDVPTSATPAHVSLARKEIVDRCFSSPEMSEIFGGLARFEDMTTGEEWIGVWGAQKASKFRRMLRERGAILVLVKAAPSNFLLKVASYGRPLDSKRPN